MPQKRLQISGLAQHHKTRRMLDERLEDRKKTAEMSTFGSSGGGSCGEEWKHTGWRPGKTARKGLTTGSLDGRAVPERRRSGGYGS